MGTLYSREKEEEVRTMAHMARYKKMYGDEGPLVGGPIGPARAIATGSFRKRMR